MLTTPKPLTLLEEGKQQVKYHWRIKHCFMETGQYWDLKAIYYGYSSEAVNHTRITQPHNIEKRTGPPTKNQRQEK